MSYVITEGTPLAGNASILYKLRVLTGSAITEFDDEALQAMLERCAAQVNSTYGTDNFTENSLGESAVLTRAMIEMSYARASNASLFYAMSSEKGSVSQQQIVSNNLSLVASLREQLQDIEGGLTDTESDVQVHTLIRVNRYGQRVPFTIQTGPTATTLAATVSGSTAFLDWIQDTSVDFYSYQVWRNTTSAVLDSYRSSGVATTSVCAAIIYNRLLLGYKDENLPSGTYYYSVGVYDRSGRHAFSDVSTVTIA